jgi:putative hydrolase of the HAD superfamily
MIRAIGFDGDDTLWHTESLYTMTEQHFQELLSPYMSADTVKARLYETEMRNLALFGYGMKGFILSMIETALEVSERQIDAAGIQAILDSGRSMLARPVEPIDHVERVLAELSQRYRLLLITKGDLFDQERKLAQTNLNRLFDHISIVSNKDEDAYERVLARSSVEVSEFAMVGNSVRSDVLPVVRLGGYAIHVPYHVTWAHEEDVAGDRPAERFRQVDSIAEVPRALSELASEAGP